MKNWFARSATSVALSTLVLALLLASPATAQRSGDGDSPRSGLWGGFGFGYGSLGCEDCSDREGGFSGEGIIGGTLSDVVRIGGGTSFYYRDDDGTEFHLGSGLFIVQVFPSASGFYLQGGAGFASSEVVAGDISVSDEGAAILLGVGYSIDLGERGKVAIVPFANWMGTSIAFEPNLFQFGFGFFWN